jgi:hypothetical protein
VPVPTVALLPTCQVTLLLLHGVAPLTSTTAALLAVVSELVIWKARRRWDCPARRASGLRLAGPRN